jgi:predicted XRE-type DNA-binding protein
VKSVGTDIWEAEGSPAAASDMRARADLAIALTERARQAAISDGELAADWRISQRALKDLRRGMIDRFSLELLEKILGNADGRKEQGRLDGRTIAQSS